MSLFLVQFGFVGFVASLLGAIWRGTAADGSTRRTLKLWLFAAAFCFALWVIGLRTFPIPFAR